MARCTELVAVLKYYLKGCQQKLNKCQIVNLRKGCSSFRASDTI